MEVLEGVVLGELRGVHDVAVRAFARFALVRAVEMVGHGEGFVLVLQGLDFADEGLDLLLKRIGARSGGLVEGFELADAAFALRSLLLDLGDGMRGCAAWDTKGSMNKNWDLLFKRLDKDFSGRLDFV